MFTLPVFEKLIMIRSNHLIDLINAICLSRCVPVWEL